MVFVFIVRCKLFLNDKRQRFLLRPGFFYPCVEVPYKSHRYFDQETCKIIRAKYGLRSTTSSTQFPVQPDSGLRGYSCFEVQ
jgi:hypothetical protein